MSKGGKGGLYFAPFKRAMLPVTASFFFLTVPAALLREAKEQGGRAFDGASAQLNEILRLRLLLGTGWPVQLGHEMRRILNQERSLAVQPEEIQGT